MTSPELQPRDYHLVKIEAIKPLYLRARLLEIEALLDWLLVKGDLQAGNLKEGVILCLGVGAGADLLALRRQTWAPILGVDSAISRPSWVISSAYSGDHLAIPEPGITDLACVTFFREDAVEFLKSQPYEICSLMTLLAMPESGLYRPRGALWASVDSAAREYIKIHGEFLRQAGLVLKPGGQLLVTSDSDQMWTELGCPWGSLRKISTVSPGYGVLSLPPPRHLLPFLPANFFAECHNYLEKGTSPEGVDNIRDRDIWIFTKA